MAQTVLINVSGVFSVRSACGDDITPKGPKSRALVAVLALSPGHRATRVWLRSLLWEDKADEQAGAGLRQMLRALRVAFGPELPLIGSDRYAVWLDDALCSVRRTRANGAEELLQGFDIGGEAFEDWLREQRQLPPERKPAEPFSETTSSFSIARRPWGVVGPVQTAIEGSQAHKIGIALTDQVIAALRAFDFVDVLDQRDTISDQLSSKPGMLEADPHFSVQTRAVGLFDEVQIAVIVSAPRTNKVLWTQVTRVPRSCAEPGDDMQMAALVARTVTALSDVVVSRIEVGRPCLLAAVHQFFSQSSAGFHSACEAFEAIADHSPVAHAWGAYALTVSQAERLSKSDPALNELITHHCRKAIESDRFNPIVNALVGHVHMLRFKRLDQAARYHNIAAQSHTKLPLALTFRAIFENYSGNHKAARAFSTLSTQLAPTTPYQFLTDTPLMLSSALTGDYQRALVVGGRMLFERPRYLGVMRHMAACLALSGQVDKAGEMVATIRKLDPQFTRDGILDPQYPLPAADSVGLLSDAFQVMGAASIH